MFDFALTFQKAYCIRLAWKFIFFVIFRIVSTFENFKSIKISFVSTFRIYIVDKNIDGVYFWKLNFKNNIFRVHFYWLVHLQASEYAIPTLQLAVGAGVLNGKSGNLLAPTGTATRAEIAAIMQRWCEKIVQK